MWYLTRTTSLPPLSLWEGRTRGSGCRSTNVSPSSSLWSKSTRTLSNTKRALKSWSWTSSWTGIYLQSLRRCQNFRMKAKSETKPKLWPSVSCRLKSRTESSFSTTKKPWKTRLYDNLRIGLNRSFKKTSLRLTSSIGWSNFPKSQRAPAAQTQCWGVLTKL